MKKIIYLPVILVVSFLFYSLEGLIIHKQNGTEKVYIVGDLEGLMGIKPEVPPGGISVLDFEKEIVEDMTMTSVKFYSTADSNKVQLKLWRLINNSYEVVAKSEYFSLSKGLNSFPVEIPAKKGDYIGIFMLSSEIDRSALHRVKGRVYVVGDKDVIPKDTPYKDAPCGYAFQIYAIGTSKGEQ